MGLCSTQLFVVAPKENNKSNEFLTLFSTTNPLFLSSFQENIFFKVGLIMYKYSNNLLPECISLLYLRNDSIHEHNTGGCHQLKILSGAKTLSNISARIWNVLSNKINCDVSMSISKSNIKLFLLHNELVLNCLK